MADTSKNTGTLSYTILIDGTELSAEKLIHSINVKKEANRISSATLVLYDGSLAKQDFETSNEDVLIPGKKIEISVGYEQERELIFKGIIIKHNLKLRSQTSLLIIECKDEAVKLTIGRKNSYFYESKDSDIFQEIIDKYSLESEIEETNFEHEEIVQYNSSDWDFVVSRAQANGKLCFTDNGKLVIKKPGFSESSVETITYGETIVDFDAEIDARNQFSSISTFSWNQADQEVTKVDAVDPNVELNSNLTSGELADVIGLKDLELKHGGNLNETESQDWADSTSLFQQLAKVRGRVKVLGPSKAAPDKTMMLEGVGDRFSGKIYVTGVFHKITSGEWTIDIQFGMNPVWFSETYDINAVAASGLLPAVKGLQYGVVSQLQDDPQGENRILVKFPIVNDSEQGIWCRLALLDAGDNRGSIFRPEIGDEVIVGFVNEDPNNAVVLGMLNSSAKPAPIEAEDDNNIKGFFTRSEMKLVFDDEKKSVTIETPGGKIFVIDEDAGEMRMEDENSNSIIMNKDGIAIESKGEITIKATKDIKAEGMNVNLKANAQLKAEGSSGVELSSSAIAVVKGSLVQIN